MNDSGTQTTGNTVVIGGGVIGISVAYFLRQAGREVTLIDAGKLGAACSQGNCGLLSPSHIFPLCQPAALKRGFNAMLQSNGPLRIRPGLNWSLWSWLMRFAGNCNVTQMMATGHARQAILVSSRNLYDELIAKFAGDCELNTKGCLFVNSTEAEFVAHQHEIGLMKREYGAEFEPLVGSELTAKEPALIEGSAYGAWFFAADAHVRPDRLLAAWIAQLKADGVTILEDCKCERFVADGRQVRGLQTTHGRLDADQVVVATGAVTPFLNRELGYNIPIQPGKGYSITMQRPAVCPQIPMIFETEKVAVTPMNSGYRIGSTMEFVGYDTTLNRSRLELLKQGASRYLKEPLGPSIENEWYGWRPMTPDGKPIIDFAPKYGNVMVAAGHNMLGLSMAPATGKLVAEKLTGQTPHIDPQPFLYPRQTSRKQSA